MNSKLKKGVYDFLMNEKILGKTTIEVNAEIISKVNKTKVSQSKRSLQAPVAVASSAKKGAELTRGGGAVPAVKTNIPSTHPLAECYKLAQECKKCVLYKTRKTVVFGEGNPNSKLLFIGEAPGAEEDSTGRPFVGEAGKLLTKMIKFLGLEREDVYIANIIKCRPPNNRDPLPDEVQNCRNWLDKQIEIINPALICALGRHSAYFLVGGGHSFSEIRGKIFDYKNAKVLPTFHPAALLYHPAWKVYAVKDFELLKKLYAEH